MKRLTAEELDDAFTKFGNPLGLVSGDMRDKAKADIRLHIAYLEAKILRVTTEAIVSAGILTLADYLERVYAKILDTKDARTTCENLLWSARSGRIWEEVAKIAVELEGYDVFLRHLDELSTDLKAAIERKD